MNVTPEQLKQLFDYGFISTDDFHAALMEYAQNCYKGGKHKASFDAGYIEGVAKTTDAYCSYVDRVSELESRVEEMAMSYNKSINAIYMRIRKAADALENCDSKTAEILLLRMLKDIL